MTKTIPPNTAQRSSATFAPRQTKAALLHTRLAKPGGVSLSEMMQLTGWQAHTLRAALSGLRKTGVILSRRREGGDTIYAIDLSGPAPASDGWFVQRANAAKSKPGIEANAPALAPVAERGLPDAAISELGKGAA